MSIDETPMAPTPRKATIKAQSNEPHSLDELGNESLSSPINFPPKYDLLTGQTCSYLVNVASNMADQWIATLSPPPASFSWTPQDPCIVTSGIFDLSKCKVHDLIWSTFTTGGNTYTEPFGFTATYNGNNYLVFRGSKTDVDFKIDAETAFTTDYRPRTWDPISNLQVQQGFYTVYKGLLQPLQQALGNLPDSSTPLTITGHSLGSALATLAVPEAVSNHLRVQQYNQASPAVGNVPFASYYNGLNCLTFRFVNTADKVPKLPPQPPYVHVGTEVDFTTDFGSEANNHNPCCTYAYAIINPQDPVMNPINFCNCL